MQRLHRKKKKKKKKKNRGTLNKHTQSTRIGLCNEGIRRVRNKEHHFDFITNKNSYEWVTKECSMIIKTWSHVKKKKKKNEKEQKKKKKKKKKHFLYPLRIPIYFSCSNFYLEILYLTNAEIYSPNISISPNILLCPMHLFIVQVCFVL